MLVNAPLAVARVHRDGGPRVRLSLDDALAMEATPFGVLAGTTTRAKAPARSSRSGLEFTGA